MEVTVDCLRGIYSIDQVSIVHDAGKSLFPMVDRGQIEGGVVQDLGWMTLEEIIYDKRDRLKTGNLTNYKTQQFAWRDYLWIRRQLRRFANR